MDALKNLVDQIIELIRGFGVEGGILDIIKDFFSNLFGAKTEG